MNKRIVKLDNFGRGIVYIDDKIAFVPNALEGELVDVSKKIEKRSYIVCNNNKVYDESSDRCKDVCKYYLICGGCNTFHMTEDKEAKFKKERAKNILMHYGNIDIKDIDIVSGNFLYYRNKITLRVSNGKLGLLEDNSDRLVNIDKCLIANKKINEIINILKDLIIDENLNKIVIRTSNEVMISLYGDVSNIDKFKDICDSLYLNDKPITNKYIVKEIGDKKYRIDNLSFFQVNDEVVKYLYDEIKNIVKNINPKKVLDLYCGVGSIGIYISQYAEEVLGVEVLPSAIDNANANKKLNNIDNISFINSKVENIIDKINDYDLMIVDPPRKGLDSKTSNILNNSNSKNIIYVSCDLVTLSRDLKLFDNYELKFIKLFNMFPRTYHVETLCLLEKK